MTIETTGTPAATNPEVPTDPTKAPSVPTQEQKAADPSASERLAAIAKRDKAALIRMRQAQAKEAEIAKREAMIKELEAKYNQKPANPIEALVKAGYSYQDATNYVLNGEKVTPEIEIKNVNARVDDFIKKQEEHQKLKAQQELEETKKQEQQVITNFKQEISDFIDVNANDYELIKLHDAQELVFATIDEYFNRTEKQGKPKIMSLKEASDLVEAHLAEKIEETVTKTNKFKSKFARAVEEKKDSVPQQTKTLTNQMTSSAASTLPARTEQDRIQRALAALEKAV